MKIIQNSLLLLLLLAFALAYPMDSSEKKGGPGDLNELKKLKESDNTLDFKLITLETWSPLAENEDRRVYLQPNDEDDTNRAEFMDKFTVGSKIFNQLLLIKTILAYDKDNDLDEEIKLPKVESNILTALLNFASFISTNEIELDEFSNVDDVSILFKLLNAANYVHFDILIKVCIKTIVQKFDFNSIENTVENLQIDDADIWILKIEEGSWKLENIIIQLETQYRVSPDLRLQIYKSIPLSGLVRFKAPAKIIGEVFIAYSSLEACTTYNEIKISLDNDKAELIGDLLVSSSSLSSIYNYYQTFGYKLDDDGNKHLLTDEDVPEQLLRYYDVKYLKRAATHPYIFEFIWYLFLKDAKYTDGRFYNHNPYSLFNRKDILKVIYESTKKPEGRVLSIIIFDILSQELERCIIFGYAAAAEYLIQIRVKLNFNSPILFPGVFQIKDAAKKTRSLDYLYKNKAALPRHEFDHYALMGYYENIVWLVEHGYQGHDAIDLLKGLQTRNQDKQNVLNYLLYHSKWKADPGSWISYGDYQGVPQPF